MSEKRYNKKYDDQNDTESTLDGLLPHSTSAEQAVLGGLMFSDDQLDDVAEIVQPADFFSADHRQIFEVMLNLGEQGMRIDAVVLAEALQTRGMLEDVGGMLYLTELARSVPTAENILNYAEIVRDRSTIRKLLSAVSGIRDGSLNPEGRDAGALVDEATQAIAGIADGVGKKGGLVDVDEVLKDTLDKIDENFNSDGGITGVSTGFEVLDDMTSGWQESDLVIVAARPSMGKTTLAMNMVEEAMFKQDRAVLVFSLEMPADSIVMRMLSAVGRIDQTKIRSGKLDAEDWPKLSAAVTKMKGRPLYIDDQPGLSPGEMRARMRRIEREHEPGIGLVMIDYLQLMRLPGNTEGRTQEISEISRSLKAIAREFKCPVIALSQLNRSLEQRPNKRPVNSDLRESGAIEQDADVIMFIYRDEVYNEESPDKGIAELIIGKQRNGPIGSVRVAFEGRYTRFSNLSPEMYGDDFE